MDKEKLNIMRPHDDKLIWNRLTEASAYHDMVKQTRCTHPAKEMPASNARLPGAKAATSYTTKYMEM